MKACLKCAKPFTPKRKEQKYCCPKCSVSKKFVRAIWSNHREQN